ncbi:DUF5362 family protein [Thiolinea disciformis]|uniref:DUF5362 family protein n=1 Tax=Thiolinea disciformis TaxID=125614 RepID=UPI00035F6F2C|nr:DUF5362 family protein [Thiolinea disciformis]
MAVENAYAPPSSMVRDVSGGTGVVSDRILAALRKTRPWVLLFAVLGFIGTAFSVLGAVGMLAGGSMLGTQSELGGMSGAMGGMIGFGIMMLLMALIYFFVSLYLLRYAGAIKRAVTGLNVADVEAALEAQASFWKLAGIMTLVGVVLYLVMVIGLAVMGPTMP